MRQCIRYGVISASGMARSHMRAIRDNPNARLAAVCDLDLAKAQSAAEQFGADQVYQDYRQLLDDDAIDAVVVCTPDQLHREMSVAALTRGKHVLCEKPMALTVADCQAMIAAERAGQARLMIGQICRYTPGFVAAKCLIEQGVIGELFFVESEYAHDYSRIVGSPTAYHWRRDPLRHPFLGGGCHAVDLLRWIAGDVTEAFGYANHLCLTDWPVNDCSLGLFQFASGAIGKVMVSVGCVRPYTMRSVFYGTEGTIVCDNTSADIQLCSQKNLTGAPAFATLPVNIASHNVGAEIREFIDCIVANKPVVTNVDEGVKTVATCIAVAESARTGKPVRVQDLL